MSSKEVKSYQARINSSDQAKGTRASILLLDAKKYTIGTLAFLEPGTPLPPNINASAPVAYYPMSTYAAVLDLLRNEGPVYIETDDHGGVWIGTLPEPVGDGDKPPSKIFPLV